MCLSMTAAIQHEPIAGLTPESNYADCGRPPDTALYADECLVVYLRVSRSVSISPHRLSMLGAYMYVCISAGVCIYACMCVWGV